MGQKERLMQRCTVPPEPWKNATCLSWSQVSGRQGVWSQHQHPPTQHAPWWRTSRPHQGQRALTFPLLFLPDIACKLGCKHCQGSQGDTLRFNVLPFILVFVPVLSSLSLPPLFFLNKYCFNFSYSLHVIIIVIFSHSLTKSYRFYYIVELMNKFTLIWLHSDKNVNDIHLEI